MMYSVRSISCHKNLDQGEQNLLVFIYKKKITYKYKYKYYNHG
jgi:hypothetical protein